VRSQVRCLGLDRLMLYSLTVEDLGRGPTFLEGTSLESRCGEALNSSRSDVLVAVKEVVWVILPLDLS